MLFVNGACVSWSSRSQRGRSYSSMEAEYYEASEAAKEVVWCRHLLEELGYPQLGATVLHEDSSACISYSKNSTCHDRTKHIDNRVLILKDQARDGICVCKEISTHDQIADILTKHTPIYVFQGHRDSMLKGLSTVTSPVMLCTGRILCCCKSCINRL